MKNLMQDFVAYGTVILSDIAKMPKPVFHYSKVFGYFHYSKVYGCFQYGKVYG